MLKPPQVSIARDPVTVGPSQTLAEAWQEMVKHGVNRCPVTVSGRGVGMISRRDLRIAASIAELDVKKGGPVDDMVKDRLMQIKVGDVMSRPLRTCAREDTIVDAAKLMRVGDVSSLAITGEDDLVVGVVTRSDLIDQLIRIYEPLQ